MSKLSRRRDLVGVAVAPPPALAVAVLAVVSVLAAALGAESLWLLSSSDGQ
jgi:hypothetical protein